MIRLSVLNIVKCFSRPHILMLVDRPNWAFDNSARYLAKELKHDFKFEIKYVIQSPPINPSKYDLIYVFFWGETYHERFNFPLENVLKEVSSHRWEDNPLYGPCNPKTFVQKYLRNVNGVICTSQRLYDLIIDFHPNVSITPNGIDPKIFYIKNKRSGEIKVGWAGNINDPVKGYTEILNDDLFKEFNIISAPGNLSYAEMNDFYNSLDVFLVTSINEGEPLTLIEAMATGCFPVCSDVGIVPELITNNKNGIIVQKRASQDYYIALKWCKENLKRIRHIGLQNAEIIKNERIWKHTSQYFKLAFENTINLAQKPKFRNDDVSADSAFENFVKFCEIFHKYDHFLIHGVTLFGNTNCLYRYNDLPVEYENSETLSKLSNEKIIELSKNVKFQDRLDLVKYLNQGNDEIALHGLYHTDYSAMNKQEIKEHILIGLELLENLFPNKLIRYFIAPFNRIGNDLVEVCKELKLEVLGNAGVQLEAEIDNIQIQSKIFYRFHHHRFYPESTFDYYSLSLEKLENCIKRNLK